LEASYKHGQDVGLLRTDEKIDAGPSHELVVGVDKVSGRGSLRW
jgi:hypothetical protein